MLASWGIGLLSLRQGDLPRALPLLERAVGICQEADFPASFPLDGCGLGSGVHSWAGASPTPCRCSRRRLEQTIAMERVAFRRSVVSPWRRRRRGLAAWRRRTPSPSVRWRSPVRTRNAVTRRMPCASSGEIAARRDPPEVELAESHYQQALALADELGMRPLQAHCHRGLGTLYATTGQREQAHTALSTAIALYRDMDMTFWLPQTEAALAQVG